MDIYPFDTVLFWMDMNDIYNIHKLLGSLLFVLSILEDITKVWKTCETIDTLAKIQFLAGKERAVKNAFPFMSNIAMPKLLGGFKYVLFSTLPGEMIKFG